MKAPSERVIRGSCWVNPAKSSCVAVCYTGVPWLFDDGLSLRLARRCV
jgi:hypothetical protein